MLVGLTSVDPTIENVYVFDLKGVKNIISRKDTKGKVYFLSDGEYIKIGFTSKTIE